MKLTLDLNERMTEAAGNSSGECKNCIDNVMRLSTSGKLWEWKVAEDGMTSSDTGQSVKQV